MSIKTELLKLDARLDRILERLENRKPERPVLKVINGGKSRCTGAAEKNE